MLEQGVPGGQVAVSRNGRLIWSEGIGLADVENSVACTPKSAMRITSISKPLCSVGLFKLWEKGLVDLDAPIQTYVPSFPEKCWDGEKVVVTMRQLLSHMSGIRYNKKKGSDVDEIAELQSTKQYDSLEQSMEMFAQDELLSKPGVEYHYSTHAWTLVGALIERVSNESFLHYMKHNLFTPLGMEATKGEFNDTLLYNRTRYYVRSSDGKLQKKRYVNLSCKLPGGGLVSTASDLVKFGTAVLASYNKIEKNTSNKSTSTNQNPVKINSNLDSNIPVPILAPPTTKLMLSAVANNVEPSQYPGFRFSVSLGWMVDSGEMGPICSQNRRACFGHTGGAVGCTSVFLVFPDQSGLCDKCGAREKCGACGVVVCVLLNLQDVKGIIKLGTNIAKQFLYSHDVVKYSQIE